MVVVWLRQVTVQLVPSRVTLHRTDGRSRLVEEVQVPALAQS